MNLDIFTNVDYKSLAQLDSKTRTMLSIVFGNSYEYYVSKYYAAIGFNNSDTIKFWASRMIGMHRAAFRFYRACGLPTSNLKNDFSYIRQNCIMNALNDAPFNSSRYYLILSKISPSHYYYKEANASLEAQVV